MLPISVAGHAAPPIRWPGGLLVVLGAVLLAAGCVTLPDPPPRPPPAEHPITPSVPTLALTALHLPTSETGTLPLLPTVAPPTVTPASLPHPAALPPAPPTPAPLRVGLQVGHWQISALPPSLANLWDQPGSEAAGRSEVDVNLDVARRVAGLLQDAGITVDLLPATVPNGYRADAFVAIHADANWARPVRGYKIAPPYRSEVAWADAVLVNDLETAYAPATGLPQDTEITDNMRGYYAINGWMGDDSRISNQTPGAVIETGFMTSAADRALIYDQPQQVAVGVANGIQAFLARGAAVETVQQQAVAVAATAPTGCSVVVLLDEVPVRAAPDPSAPAVAWVNRGAVLPYLDSTARPTGPFTWDAGRQLVTATGYYRVTPPGGGPPAYINHGPVIVQLPAP